MLVDFINKLYDFEQKLQEALLICMKHYNKKFKSIKYNYRNVSYNIELRYILYIEKEPGTKRSKVKTEHGDFYIQGPLDDIMKQLDERFRKCGRSLIINIEQVERYNTKSNTVIFNNNERLTSVPREKRKELESLIALKDEEIEKKEKEQKDTIKSHNEEEKKLNSKRKEIYE